MRIFFVIILILLMVVQINAESVEEWIFNVDYPTSTSHKILYKKIDYIFDPEEELSTYDVKIAWLVGGFGNSTDFTFSEEVYGKVNIKFSSGLIKYPGQNIIKFPKKAFTLNNTFGGFVLYSDYYSAVWHLNNIPVGSVVYLEYSVKSDRLKNFNTVYLQSGFSCDSTVIGFKYPEEFSLELDSSKTGEISINYLKNGFILGQTEAWESKDYDGGFSHSAPRISCYLRKKENNPTWNDVNAQVTGWFEGVSKKCKENFPEDWTLSQCIDDFESRYRYVAIEVGKGSHIPHKPKDVIRNKYGDCKDLSLAFGTLLTNPEFIFYPTLVSTRKMIFYDDRPSPYQFNHAIVTLISTQGDTIFYDPTAEGYNNDNLPWGIQGRPALILDGKSTLITLPQDTIPKFTKHMFTGKACVDGALRGELKIELDRRIPQNQLDSMKDDDIKDIVRGNINDKFYVSTGEVNFDSSEYVLSAQIVIKGVTRKLGSNLLIAPYIFEEFSVDTIKAAGLDGYFFNRPAKYTAEINLEFENTIEEVAQSGSVENSCGFCNYNVSTSSNELKFEWEFSRNNYHYENEKQAELNELYSAARESTIMRLKL